MTIGPSVSSPSALGAGIHFKPQHFQEIIETQPEVGWFEVHSENYMGRGGPSLKQLAALRARYPVSLHGVSLSLGSHGNLSQDHLSKLKKLIDWIEPVLISEHLAWSRLGATYLNDLLPLPYTAETLQILCDHIEQTQDFLQQQILIENPSTYITFKSSTREEADFLISAVQRTGCKLLLDINNVYVSAHNHGFDAQQYLAKIPRKCVGEIHLAGHCERQIGEHTLCIDDHGSRVKQEVWTLYQNYMKQHGPLPTMVEWDTDIPSLQTLVEEAQQAEQVMQTSPGVNDALAS